jgi:hypothetical protein
VVEWGLRVFLVTLLDVKSELRIACASGYREIWQILSGMQNARFGWSNKQKESDLAQT